jgi:hypothetical protein
MALRRAVAAAARSARVRAGARLSHHASYRSATASRSFGLMVRASPRTSWLMAVSRTPRARAMRAEPWPMTWRARSRSRVPPASTRPRGTVALVTARMAVVVPRVGRRRPVARPETVAGARPAVVAMAW